MMEAVLLYNEKEYNGTIEVNSSLICFAYSELDTVKLVLQIALSGISEIQYWKLYRIKIKGIELTTNNAIRFVFLVDDPQVLMLQLARSINA